MKCKQWLALVAVLLCVPLFSGCQKQETKERDVPASAVATRPPQQEAAGGAATRPPQQNDADVQKQGDQAETVYRADGNPVEDSGSDYGVSWYITRDGAGYALYVSGTSIPDGWLGSVARFTNTDSNGGNSLIGQIKRLEVADDVTEIGGRAFAGCTALTDVTLGAGVSSMGNQVFFGCQNLYQVKFNGTKVPDNALKDNTAVQYVQLIAGCTAIGDNAFNGCTALRSVDGTASALVQLGDGAFAKCTALGAVPEMTGLRIMGSSAFAECTAIKRIEFPQTLTSIGSYAFQGCTALQELVFPKRGDLGIGNNAFENCTALSSVKLTTAVYSAGDAAFRGCTALMSLTLGGQSSLGADLLSGCSNVTVTVVGSLPEDALRDSAAVVKANFDGCRVISARAFNGCTALKELSFREDKPVEIIGEEAFRGCSALTIVTLCPGLKEIGSRAFADCTGMKEITMPKSLKKIGSAVFSNSNFSDNYTTAIRYEGSKTSWENDVEKPKRPDPSWSAGIVGVEWADLEIKCLNR